ncbi:unnamed protein product [Adineta steineri]|uniref:Uncharacterized protein n=1 Tax=Adineta steineri TaxID=433720 RepID=A0A814IH02_9BILA|nr:unnamed protein product [Adineta steineri]
MDDTFDFDKPVVDTKDDASLYLDFVRLVESNQLRRFESSVNKFDIIQYELNDGPSKPLLFYAIERNDEVFTKLILDMEVPLDKEYSVSQFLYKKTNVFFCLEPYRYNMFT